MKTSCNRKLFAKRFRETRAVRGKVHVTFRPLYDHLISLARNDLKYDHCQSAGQMLSKAKKLVGKHAWAAEPTEEKKWLKETREHAKPMQKKRIDARLRELSRQ